MKGLISILAAVLLALTLVACGGGQEAESTTPTEEAATTEPAVTEPTETTETPAVTEGEGEGEVAEPEAEPIE